MKSRSPAVVGADADGKVKFWVTEAGAAGKYENAHKISLRFEAVGDGVETVAALAGVADLPAGSEPTNDGGGT